MLHHTIQGHLVGNDLKIAVVVSRFNTLITEKLLAGCLDTLSRHGVAREDMAVVWVPGAFEIPFAARKLVALAQFDAVICLGAVIRGETPHFDYVCRESAKGVGALNQTASCPVLYGILTTNTLEEAFDRAGGKAGNKGAEAAVAALEMAHLNQALQGLTTGPTQPQPTTAC